MNAVQALYQGSSVSLSLGKTEGQGFPVSSGIKQGCPMSGGIWCLIFDPFICCFLDALRGSDASLSAFADDIGIPCGDLCSYLKLVVPVVDLMGSAAGLSLNWRKTVFVNFSRHSDFELRRLIEQAVPFASAAKIERAARYLGFMSGPDALDVAWLKPCKRSLSRARHVRSLGFSLVEVVVAFDVFVFSVLRFHFQLVPLSPWVVGEVGLAVDVATATPRFSLGCSVLFRLRLFGFHVEVHHLVTTARATAYRTAKQSEVFGDPCCMLDRAMDSDDAILYPRLAGWRETSPINFLRKIVREVEAVPGIVGLAESCSNFQRKVVNILSSSCGSSELVDVLTRRIAHLGFESPDELAQSFILNLNCISKFVKPFALTAVLKTVCNAWPTSRRYGHT